MTKSKVISCQKRNCLQRWIYAAFQLRRWIITRIRVTVSNTAENTKRKNQVFPEYCVN